MTRRDSPALNVYRSLRHELLVIRVKHNGKESKEEEAHLDKMDVAWRNLTVDEIDYLRNKP